MKDSHILVATAVVVGGLALATFAALEIRANRVLDAKIQKIASGEVEFTSVTPPRQFIEQYGDRLLVARTNEDEAIGCYMASSAIFPTWVPVQIKIEGDGRLHIGRNSGTVYGITSMESARAEKLAAACRAAGNSSVIG